MSLGKIRDAVSKRRDQVRRVPENYGHVGEFLLELAGPVRDIDVQGFMAVSGTRIFDKMTVATD